MKEKNWFPFILQFTLYMYYMEINYHIVRTIIDHTLRFEMAFEILAEGYEFMRERHHQRRGN